MKNVLCGLLALGLVYGCGDSGAGSEDDDSEVGSSSSSSGGGSSSSSSGGAAASSSGGSGGGSSSSSSSGGSSSSSSGGVSCEGDCAELALTITNGTKSGQFGWAWFALDPDGVHVEAHRGGEVEGGCPDDSSPTPDFTAIMTLPDTGAALTLDDGLAVSFLDFSEEIDPALPPAKVTSASLTPVADGTDFLAFDIHAEFAQGAVLDGHVYAKHCPDLDQD